MITWGSGIGRSPCAISQYLKINYTMCKIFPTSIDISHEPSHPNVNTGRVSIVLKTKLPQTQKPNHRLKQKVQNINLQITCHPVHKKDIKNIRPRGTRFSKLLPYAPSTQLQEHKKLAWCKKLFSGFGRYDKLPKAEHAYPMLPHHTTSTCHIKVVIQQHP